MLAAVATCARASQDPATNHEDELDMEMDEDDEDRVSKAAPPPLSPWRWYSNGVDCSRDSFTEYLIA